MATAKLGERRTTDFENNSTLKKQEKEEMERGEHHRSSTPRETHKSTPVPKAGLVSLGAFSSIGGGAL